MPEEEKRPSRTLKKIITIVAVVGALYHLISTQWLFQTFLEHQNNHFAFSLVLVLLVILRQKPKQWVYIMVLMIIGLVATGYVKIFFSALQERAGFPTTADVVIGIMLVVIALEASRLAFGLAIPILACIFIGYDLFGHYLPDPFYHIKRISELLGEDISDLEDLFIRKGPFRIDHLIAGNRLRMSKEITVRMPDEEWKTKLLV